MEIMDYIQNERNFMHLQREPDKPDRISWVVDVISMWFHKFQSDILSRATLQLLPTAKPGITKDKQKDLKFFLQLLQPENQEWLSTVTMVGEQTLESNNMSDEESDFE